MMMRHETRTAARGPRARLRKVKSRKAGFRRFETEVLLRIERKGSSGPELSKALGVSLATVNRAIAALRARGENIMSVRTKEGWRYEARCQRTEEDILNDPLVRKAGFIKRWKVVPGKDEDDIIYGEE